MIRAKFTVQEIRQSYSATSRTVILRRNYDTNTPEDQRFAKATPSGELVMFVDNPVALEELQLGRTFYLDFIPVGEPVVAAVPE